MDWIAWRDTVGSDFKKYRWVVLIVLIGIFLMAFPGKQENIPTEESDTQQTPSLQETLSTILSKVDGAGKVEVLLTQSAGEKICYQMDEDRSDTTLRKETVLVSNSSREEEGLVQQILPPTYQGAIILCQGADNAKIRLSMTEAVMRVTGLTSDRITVLTRK